MKKIYVILLFMFTLMLSAQVSYTVKSGDTLYSLAKNNGVTIQDLYKLNPNLETKGLRLGETIKLPASSVQKIATPVPVATNGEYVVKAGDTLYSLATKNKIKLKQLLEINPGLTAENLQVGQTIIIDKKYKKDVPAIVAKQEKEATQVIDKTKYIPYVVKKGETIYSLSNTSKMTQEEFIQLNGQAKYGVKEGMVVYIPKPKPKQITKNINDEILVALILPFNSKNPKENKQRTEIATNFYKGSIQALDSLQKQNYKLKVKVIDNAGSLETTNTKLTETDLSGYDLIFGPFRSDNVHKVADKYKNTSVKIVSPFSEGIETLNRPNLIDATLKTSALTERLFANIDKEKASKNIYVIGSKNANLLTSLKSKYPTSKVLDISLINEYDLATLPVNSTIILNTDDEKIANEAILEFNKIIQLSNAYKANFVALGYNKAYIKSKKPSNLYVGDEILNHLKLDVLLENYADEFSYASNKARESYKKTNGVYPDQAACMGFDITYGLINNFNYLKLDTMRFEGIYNNFNFEKDKNGAYINTGIIEINN